MNTQSEQRPLSANSTKLCADDDGVFSGYEAILVESKTSKPKLSLTNTSLHFNGLGEYTEQMSAELQRDVQDI